MQWFKFNNGLICVFKKTLIAFKNLSIQLYPLTKALTDALTSYIVSVNTMSMEKKRDRFSLLIITQD